MKPIAANNIIESFRQRKQDDGNAWSKVVKCVNENDYYLLSVVFPRGLDSASSG